MTLLPNTNAKEARQILMAELNKMKTHPVSQEELQRAKAQFLSGYIFSQDSFGSVARAIGMYAVLGLSQQQRLQYIKNIEAVTAQQVQDVARNYLLAQKSVVTELLPVANNNSSGSKQ